VRVEVVEAEPEARLGLGVERAAVLLSSDALSDPGMHPHTSSMRTTIQQSLRI
jgi:hypothetical protein